MVFKFSLDRINRLKKTLFLGKFFLASDFQLENHSGSGFLFNAIALQIQLMNNFKKITVG